MRTMQETCSICYVWRKGYVNCCIHTFTVSKTKEITIAIHANYPTYTFLFLKRQVRSLEVCWVLVLFKTSALWIHLWWNFQCFHSKTSVIFQKGSYLLIHHLIFQCIYDCQYLGKSGWPIASPFCEKGNPFHEACRQLLISYF